MTEIYLVFAGLLTGAALVHNGDVCTKVLALGLVASLAVMALNPWSYMPYAGAIDALVVVMMIDLWIKHRSQRARLIGFIGLGKAFASWVQFLAGAQIHPLYYIAIINGGFIVQVAIAGGYGNAVGRWLDSLLTGVAPRRWSLFRDGGG